jgi:cysteinyl-tRNA synthetase
MELRLYNTLSREKEIFKPIKNNHVGVYCCGPTTYWYQHIGNLRSYIFSDLLKRTLEYNNFKVKQVVNVTDVGHLTSDADTGEDKMEKAIKKEGRSAKEISNYYLKIFKEDLKKLNILPPDHWPKATQHIKEQKTMIETLEEKGYTYTTTDGIYFNTSKFKNYGILTGLKKQKRQAGKRVPLGEKKHKTDFALWKFSPENEKRQQEWDFKGRKGFPGWHIECSAMSMKYLGESFDIHTGGEDHIHIHHTNEIAQAEAATGKKFVNYWLHGAFLTFKGEKVSKSKGGLHTLSELEEKNFSPLAYRYLCLTAHYHRPLEFSLESLESAQNSYSKLKDRVQELKESTEKIHHNTLIQQYKGNFLKFINNDLDLPQSLALIWTLLKDTTLNSKEKYTLIIDFDKVLGLNLDETQKKSLSSEIKDLIKSRETARKKKDFKRADEIREHLERKGIILEDTEKGVRWKMK